MRVKVLKGAVVYKGKEYVKGVAFNCEKSIVSNLIVANIVQEVKEPIKQEVKKPASKVKEK